MIALGLIAAAFAAEPGEVTTPAGSGAVVNWTRLVVEAEAEERGAGIAGHREAIEQRARSRVGPALLDGARLVPVEGGRTVADVEAELGEALRSRYARWSVVEARYYHSGRVELVGELSLQDLLKPWVHGRAVAELPDAPSAYTGLVVDARGLAAEPTYSPVLVGADGSVLFDGRLGQNAALDAVPAVWVSSPAHPAAASQAGARPKLAVAASADGSTLTLGADDTADVWDQLTSTGVLAHGTLVVVVGP